MDLGPKTWATPAPIFRWGICIVGILLMMFGIWSLWDLENTGTIFVRGMGRISAGNAIWAYRFVLAVLLALATGMTSLWFWFPKITAFQNGITLPCGRQLLWADDFECEQIQPGRWELHIAGERIDMVVYDAPSIKPMERELKSRGKC